MRQDSCGSFPAERKIQDDQYCTQQEKMQQVLSQVAFFREVWNRQSPKSLFILSCKPLFQSRIVSHYWAFQTAFL